MSAAVSNGVFINHVEQKQTGPNMSEEKHELSEVPLMSDTDKEKTDPSKDETGEKKDEGTEKAKKAGFQMKFKFGRGKSGERKEKDGAAAEHTEEPTETKVTETPAEGPKKEKFNAKKWFEKKTHKPGEATDAPAREPKPDVTFGLNLLDRDEKHINDHVKLQFEDIFAEPEGYHSYDCAWRATFRTFRFVRTIVYRLLAAIFAIPLAILWGIVFGLLSCLNVWACVPTARAFSIGGTWLGKLWNFIVRALFDPLFRSIGLCLSSISVRREIVTTPPQAVHIA